MSDLVISLPGEDCHFEHVICENKRRTVDSKDHISTRQGGSQEGNDGGCGRRNSDRQKLVDVTRDKPVRVTVKVAVPVREHPKFNFVGKLLGPKGNSVKRLQENTMTKMAILGRGSMKDKAKEEELRLSGEAKFCHLHEDLHIEITAYAPPAEAYARIAFALSNVRRFLVPKQDDHNDDIRQEQMWEMQVLKERPKNPPVIEDGLGIHLLGDTVPIAAAGREIISPANSICSQSPQASPPDVLTSMSPSFILPSRLPAGNTTLTGRERPLLSASSNSVSPTKRSVPSILARAGQSKADHILRYHVNI